MTEVLGNPPSSTATATKLVINKCHTDGVGGGSGGGINSIYDLVGEKDDENVNLHKEHIADGILYGLNNDGDHDEEDDEVRNFFF